MSIVSTGQLTIVDNNDGTSATLSRETIFVPSNSAGVVITYAGLETTMKVVVGATDDSANWTFYVSAIGTGISYRDSDDGADRTGTGIVNGLLTGTRGLVKIVGATQDASYIEITADRAGYPNPIRRIEVVKTKSGAAGVDAVIGYLTNEATIIPTDAAGNGGVFTAAGGTFKVYEGIVDKTGNVAVTYSVVSSSGVTISIASTGVYTITAMSANSGTALLRAVYGTVTTDKVYSIAKSIAGATGVVGQRGSRTFYVALTGATNTWSDSLATTTATAEGGPVLNDMVVQYNNSMNFSQSKFYQVIATVPTWVLINAVVDGNLLVSGTVGATHIQANTFTADNAVTRGLTVRDTSGNIILSSGVSLDYTRVGGTKPPANATVGATFGSDISGKITGTNVSTFIEDAAIKNAHIGTLDAQKINTGYLSADRIQAGTIDVTKLNVGVGTNILNNAGFSSGMYGWGKGENGTTNYSTMTLDLAGYTPRGGHCIYIVQPNNIGAGNVNYSQYILSQQVPVEAGKRYEFSAYTGAHRCIVSLLLYFYDSAGSSLGSTGSTDSNVMQASGSNQLSAFKRLSGFVTAPANAASCAFLAGKTATAVGQSDSYMFMTQPQVAEASANQTVPSSWSLGGSGTVITGAGIETPSLSALSANVGLLRTTATGARMEIESNVLRVYDTNGTLRVKLGNLA